MLKVEISCTIGIFWCNQNLQNIQTKTSYVLVLVQDDTNVQT